MQEDALNTGWIERCARRLQLRHMVPQQEAMELASVMHEELGDQACPERAAEQLFSTALH